MIHFVYFVQQKYNHVQIFFVFQLNGSFIYNRNANILELFNQDDIF